MATTTEVENLERPSKAVSTRVRYGILGVIVVATAINYMDRANLSIVAPDVKRDLHISAAELGLIFSAFSWTYAALQIPGGWVLDRIGPRITFGVALIFWSIVTGSISLAKGFTSLLGLRLALGVAETPAFPANNFRDRPHRKRRGRGEDGAFRGRPARDLAFNSADFLGLLDESAVGEDGRDDSADREDRRGYGGDLGRNKERHAGSVRSGSDACQLRAPALMTRATVA